MSAGLALIVLAIGIHGAQKRRHRALFFYGAVSLASLLLSIVAGMFIVGFFLFGGANSVRGGAGGQFEPQPHGMVQHARGAFVDMMQKGGLVDVTTTTTTTVTASALDVPPVLSESNVDAADGTTFELVNIGANPDLVPLQIPMPKTKKTQLTPLVFPNKLQPLEQPVNVVVNADGKPVTQPADESSEEESGEDSSDADADGLDDEDTEVQVRLTPFGYLVVALAMALGLFMFVLKVQSIRLAFLMRRMLLAIEQPSLPTTSRCQLATPPKTTNDNNCVRPPTGPAPTPRRDCPRCTYVNAAGAVRCAMCDSALPIVAAPVVSASAPVPRVYVPGSLYPLNAPLN